MRQCLQDLNLSRKELGEILLGGYLLVEILDGNLKNKSKKI